MASQFHLFQRVRIVGYCDSGKAVVGREGVIHSALRAHRLIPSYFGHVVMVDGDPDPWFFEPAHLAPILYLPTPEDFVSLERVPPDVLETVRA